VNVALVVCDCLPGSITHSQVGPACDRWRSGDPADVDCAQPSTMAIVAETFRLTGLYHLSSSEPAP
jgi:hypothetical protein